MYSIAPGETSGEKKGGERRMNEFNKKIKEEVKGFHNPLDIMDRIRSMVLWLSQENNERIKGLLRLTINEFLDRLKEVTYTGGEKG